MAIERGAFACVVRDSDGEYLKRICGLIESFAEESNFVTTQALPCDPDDDAVDLADLEALAAEVRGEMLDTTAASLVVTGGPDVGKTVQLGATLAVVGRDISCQLSLTDESISRFHAIFKQYPQGAVVVRDLGSTNGTHVKGKRIKSAELEDGDEILLGKNTVIKFQL